MFDEYGNEISWIPDDIKNKDQPLYKSIAENLEDDIKNGILKNGFKLPPQRILANYLKINHSTITKAYRLCEEKGLIKGITGKGTFVSYSGIPHHILVESTDTNIIEMGIILPMYKFNDIIESYVKEIYNNIDYNTILKYTPPEGHIKHRFIASKWLEQFEISVPKENIVIASGTQNALSVILTGFFNKGDRIIVDEYTYPGFINLCKFLGIIMVPAKSDENGIDLDEVNKICKRESVKGIYLIPDSHNPTSVCIKEDKRIEVAKLIKDKDLLLIEDAQFSFTLEEKIRPISHYAPDNSIYIAGITKSLGPSFRISYMVSSKKYIQQLIYGINNINFMASSINAELISQIINSSMYDELMKLKIAEIVSRNTLTDKLLEDYKLIPSKTSYFRFLELDPNISDDRIELECVKKGVQIFSSKRFLTTIKSNRNALRISTSGPDNIEELEKGLNILKDVIKCSGLEMNLII